jgi:signal transduction histidine kinase
MQLTTTRKVTLGFAASLGIMGAMAIISLVSTHRLVDDIRLVAHTYEVLGELRDIPEVSSVMQAGVRGFLIAGNEEFLKPFWAAKADAHHQVQQVRELTADKPEKRLVLDEIENYLNLQIIGATNVIAVRKSEGFAAAETFLTANRGKYSSKVKELVQKMTDEELVLLEQRNAKAAHSAQLANGLIVVGGVLTVTVMGIALFILRQDIRERERLERAILEISDREQLRFGRDLHDSLCQELAGIAFMGQVIERKLAPTAPAEAVEVGRMAALVGKSVVNARNLARGLQPVEVEANGLMVALEELARTIQEMFHVKCRFVCEKPVLITNNAVAVHLYRIVQEAVHNAIRHGGARNIEIRVRRSHQEATLEISDDGSGMPEEASAKKGTGIETMRYRAVMIGATLKIRPGPSAGTIVTCAFGLVPSKAEEPKAGTKTKVMQAV